MRAFEVGDKVVLYTSLDGRVIGTIQEVEPQQLCIIWTHAGAGKIKGWYHPKQCRRLKNVSLRDFWINEKMIPHMADDVATENPTDKYPNTAFIKVREVKVKK